jgi:transcriptional regulator with XRE-family HTH domain
MSLHDALSVNLTRLCQAKGSIAGVCRATKINRQQFNRYLSGEAVPNQRNREKICRYFGIAEHDLFAEAVSEPAGSPDTAREIGGSWSHREMRAAMKLIYSEPPTSIRQGIYFVHFAIPQDQSSIMRSVLIVRNDGSLATFRRLTGFSEPRGSWWSHFTGDHKGIIIERLHWLYFIGLNWRGTREPNLLALRWLPISEPMLGGQAMIMTPSGPAATAAVMTPCGRATRLGAAIKASHVYSADDARLDPMVMDALDQQCQTLGAAARRVDLSVRPLPEAAPRGRQ